MLLATIKWLHHDIKIDKVASARSEPSAAFEFAGLKSGQLQNVKNISRGCTKHALPIFMTLTTYSVGQVASCSMWFFFL